MWVSSGKIFTGLTLCIPENKIWNYGCREKFDRAQNETFLWITFTTFHFQPVKVFSNIKLVSEKKNFGEVVNAIYLFNQGSKLDKKK